MRGRLMRQGLGDADLVDECLALIREATWRELGMRHFPVQLMGGLVMLVFLANASYQTIRIFKESLQQVSHTKQVLVELNAARAKVPTGQMDGRPSSLTGPEQSLESDHGLLTEMRERLGRLENLGQGNPVQQNRLQILKATVNGEQKELRKGIDKGQHIFNKAKARLRPRLKDNR